MNGMQHTWETRNSYKLWMGKYQEKRALWRLKYTCEDNIKINCERQGCEDMVSV